MMKRILFAMTVAALLGSPAAHAKPKPKPKPKATKELGCDNHFSMVFSGVEEEESALGRRMLRLYFDLGNKSKKNVAVVDGNIGFMVKGAPNPMFVRTDPIEWAEPLEKGDVGTFSVLLPIDDMNVRALARGSAQVGAAMMYANILYDDNSFAECGSKAGYFAYSNYDF